MYKEKLKKKYNSLELGKVIVQWLFPTLIYSKTDLSEKKLGMKVSFELNGPGILVASPMGE